MDDVYKWVPTTVDPLPPYFLATDSSSYVAVIDIYVLCQAISQRQSSEPFPPATQHQPSTPPALSHPQMPSDTGQTLKQAPTLWVPSVGRSGSREARERSPQDTPSVESFTQSQLGDDERSSESELSSHDHPPRTTSLYLSHGLPDFDEIMPTHALGKPLPISHLASPRGINTPQSAASSDRTPTQAFFTGVTGTMSKQSPHEQYSTPQPHGSGNQLQTASDTNDRTSEPPLKQSSGDSKTTIRATNDIRDPRLTTAVTASPEPSEPDIDLISRAPARMSALRESEVPFSRLDMAARRDRSQSRPVSQSRRSLGVPRTYSDNQIQHSNTDYEPANRTHSHQPTPTEPTEPPNCQVPVPQSRGAPIHHGIEHDFVPDSDHERRSRSRSYSKASTKSRPSQDSPASQWHVFSEDPASKNNDEVPSQLFSGQIPREASRSSRQQAPEYEIEGTGPSLEWPADTQTRSRRGSKSSAFFRSLTSGSSSKADDEPPLPNTTDNQITPKPISNNFTTDEKKRKSLSLFRSHTGTSGSGGGNGQHQGPTATSTSNVPQYNQPAYTNITGSRPVEDDEFPSRGTSRNAASKISTRLQKANSPDTPVQEGSKKKRFSGLGASILLLVAT